MFMWYTMSMKETIVRQCLDVLKRDDIKNELSRLGYNPDGTEKYYNGFTGQEIPNPLVLVINYYHRLKHLVDDKSIISIKPEIFIIPRVNPIKIKCKISCQAVECKRLGNFTA